MTKKAPNPTDKHVGARIRIRRHMLDMSQTDLAEGLGLTFQQVQKYEKGANRVGASRLQQIANILQIDIPYFFEGGPVIPGALPAPGSTRPQSSFVTDFLTTRDGLDLAKAYMALKSKSLKQSVLNFVEQIAADKARR